LYWVIVSMTTMGYGDITPRTPMAKLAAIVYLPCAVAGLSQTIAGISSIATRRRIREEDHGAAADTLLLEAAGGDPDESITEGEFLVMVLQRQGLVDSDTITAIKRQFRQLVRHGDGNVPYEMRVFDAKSVFHELLERERIGQRPAGKPPGAKKMGRELVDLHAWDGGYMEWRAHHWERRIAAKLREMKAAGTAAVRSGQKMARKTIHLRGGYAMYMPLGLQAQALPAPSASA